MRSLPSASRTDSTTTAWANGSSSRVRSRSFSRMTSRDPFGLRRRRQEVVRIGGLPLGQVRREHLEEPVHALARPRGDGHDLAEGVTLRELRPISGRSFVLADPVDLVEREDRRHAGPRDEVEDELLPRPALLRGVDDEEHEVGDRRGRPSRRAPWPRSSGTRAGGFRACRQSAISHPAAAPRPRMRLRVVWGLSETIATFSPTSAVDERGLAGVGPADDGDLADAQRRRVRLRLSLRLATAGWRRPAAPTGSTRTR